MESRPIMSCHFQGNGYFGLHDQWTVYTLAGAWKRKERFWWKCLLCTFIALPFCPISAPYSCIIDWPSYRGDEWKGLKRCDKHFTVENQVWQASTLFTSVLKIPTKSCGFFSKNTMTGVRFWSRLLCPNNPGSHRCYHSSSQQRNGKCEKRLLEKNLSAHFGSQKMQFSFPSPDSTFACGPHSYLFPWLSAAKYIGHLSLKLFLFLCCSEKILDSLAGNARASIKQ